VAGDTLSYIEASTGIHVLCYACRSEGMTTYSFVESAGVGSSLHELLNARPVHMPELRRFLAFSKRREKRSRGIRSKTGGEKPLVDGFPGLRVNGHVVDFAAFFAKAQPTLPFPLVVAFDLECYNGRHSRPSVE
jgi:hypothetical protein